MNTNTNKTPTTIIGIGTDIIEIDRFKSAMDKYGQKLLDRLFSIKEQEHCLKYSDPTPRFTARFAAKESVVKSLGEGFGKNIGFLDIEILNEPSGKPTVHLSPKCQEHFKYPNLELSISHSQHYATAMVIATSSAEN